MVSCVFDAYFFITFKMLHWLPLSSAMICLTDVETVEDFPIRSELVFVKPGSSWTTYVHFALFSMNHHPNILFLPRYEKSSHFPHLLYIFKIHFNFDSQPFIQFVRSFDLC
jgi:hypothetical protein